MSYAELPAHRSMIFDEERNRLYAQALQKVIRPESVVLDLGAGVGVLGLLAAAAGAKRVYLVEPEPVVQMARLVARANGLEDRIRILEGRIEDVQIPEQVDVIVSVFTGNLLFTEGLLPSLYFARERYLKPGGHLVPDAAELWFSARALPGTQDKYVGRWSRPMLGLDLSPLRPYAGNHICWPSRAEISGKALTVPVCALALDLHSARAADCDIAVETLTSTTGRCDALLGWIRIRLGDAWLSSDPESPEVHWSPAVLPIDPALDLVAGDPVRIGFKCPMAGDWSWSLAARNERRQHSTFLGRWAGMDRLRKMAADSRLPLGVEGQLRRQVLDLMAASRSNAEIADALLHTHPERFRDATSALAFVQALALRFRSAPG
jgi:SAM-dependent methyltransferase